MRDVVNEDDEVVGQADKAEIEAKGLICRVAFILLLSKDGRLLLQQRKATKRFYPLYWSGAAAGHLISGESYEVAAHRELFEELGIETDLHFLGRFLSTEDREMVGVLAGYHDGPVSVEEMEVEQVRLFSLEELAQRPDDMLITSFVERSLPMLDSFLSQQQSAD
jgi:isopentenyl-diphosphate delta-isomerase